VKSRGETRFLERRSGIVAPHVDDRELRGQDDARHEGVGDVVVAAQMLASEPIRQLDAVREPVLRDPVP